ncbi:MAG: metallophosphoesterase [Caldilineaceae bacterium]|nr:metallophosphoesterase [Caldilineaceae bacterium]
MRILAVSDKVVPILYSGGIRDHVGDVDLILGCGDLPHYYLDFVISMLNKPCYFVFGNHGKEAEYWSNNTTVSSPHGAVNLHRQSYREQGLLLAGLEGSMRYNSAPKFQYTEGEMWGNIAKLVPKLMYNRLRYGRFLDILVAHSPPFGIHDQPDRAHTGFQSFLKFMHYFKPRYLLHGHIHLYRRDETTYTRYLETDVVNVYPYRFLEIEPAALTEKAG